jgi:hypothetical protein
MSPEMFPCPHFLNRMPLTDSHNQMASLAGFPRITTVNRLGELNQYYRLHKGIWGHPPKTFQAYVRRRTLARPFSPKEMVWLSRLYAYGQPLTDYWTPPKTLYAWAKLWSAKKVHTSDIICVDRTIHRALEAHFLLRVDRDQYQGRLISDRHDLADGRVRLLFPRGGISQFLLDHPRGCLWFPTGLEKLPPRVVMGAIFLKSFPWSTDATLAQAMEYISRSEWLIQMNSQGNRRYVARYRAFNDVKKFFAWCVAHGYVDPEAFRIDRQSQSVHWALTRSGRVWLGIRPKRLKSPHQRPLNVAKESNPSQTDSVGLGEYLAEQAQTVSPPF